MQGEKEVENLPREKFESTANRGLGSQQCEGREYMRENVSLNIIKTATFLAYAAILLFLY